MTNTNTKSLSTINRIAKSALTVLFAASVFATTGCAVGSLDDGDDIEQSAQRQDEYGQADDAGEFNDPSARVDRGEFNDPSARVDQGEFDDPSARVGELAQDQPELARPEEPIAQVDDNDEMQDWYEGEGSEPHIDDPNYRPIDASRINDPSMRPGGTLPGEYYDPTN